MSSWAPKERINCIRKQDITSKVISLHSPRTGYCLPILLDMQNFSRQNKGFRYILLCIDVFTRRGYAQSLKSKSKSSVRDGFDTFFQALDITVSLIITDSDKEFMNRGVQDVFKQLKIRHATVEGGDHNALGIIDRFSRTIRNRFLRILLKIITLFGMINCQITCMPIRIPQIKVYWI